MRLALACPLFGLLLACATTTPPASRGVKPEGTSIDSAAARPEPHVRLASAPGPHTGVATPPGVLAGEADLRKARELLARARGHMDPRKWALLDNKVAEAQKALEAARAARAAAAVSGAEAAAESGGAGELIEAAPRVAMRGVASEVAAAIGWLLLLWPSTAEAPTLRPETQYEIKLWEAAQAAQQVREEIERAAESAPATQPTKEASKQAIKEDRTPEWKQRCIDTYVDCKNQGWKGDCYACFRYCEGQRRWPNERCYPPWERRR